MPKRFKSALPTSLPVVLVPQPACLPPSPASQRCPSNSHLVSAHDCLCPGLPKSATASSIKGAASVCCGADHHYVRARSKIDSAAPYYSGETVIYSRSDTMSHHVVLLTVNLLTHSCMYSNTTFELSCISSVSLPGTTLHRIL